MGKRSESAFEYQVKRKILKVCFFAVLLTSSACSPPLDNIRTDCTTGQDCGLAFTGDVCGECQCESTPVNVEEIPRIIARNEAEDFCPFRDPRVLCDCFPSLVPYCADDGCQFAFPDEVPLGADVKVDDCIGIRFQCDADEDSALISQIEAEFGRCDAPVNSVCRCEAASANGDHCLADVEKLTQPILTATNSNQEIRCDNRCRQ